MASIFSRPTDSDAEHSLRVLNWLLLGFAVSGVILWLMTMIANSVTDWIRKFMYKQARVDTRNWKPWAMETPFLGWVLIVTIVLIIVIRQLWHISSLQDKNSSRK